MVRGWGGVFPKARQSHVIGYFMHKCAGMVGVRRLGSPPVKTSGQGPRHACHARGGPGAGRHARHAALRDGLFGRTRLSHVTFLTRDARDGWDLSFWCFSAFVPGEILRTVPIPGELAEFFSVCFWRFLFFAPVRPRICDSSTHGFCRNH